MISSFYPAGSDCIVQCLPVGGAKVTQITAKSQMQRHLLAEGCILFLGPKVSPYDCIRAVQSQSYLTDRWAPGSYSGSGFVS